MDDFFEIDQNKKTVKTLDLDDFSLSDLEIYISELKAEIKRVEEDIKKKISLKDEANKHFK